MVSSVVGHVIELVSLEEVGGVGTVAFPQQALLKTEGGETLRV